MNNIFLSTSQAAELLCCSYKTVINYCKSRKLNGIKSPVTGYWRVSLQSVLQLQKNVQGAISDDLS